MVPNVVVPPVAPNEKADFGAAVLVELAVFPPNALVLGGAPAGVVENALKPAGLLGVVVDMLFVIDEPPNTLEPGVVDEVGAPKPKAAGVLAPAGAVVEVVVCPGMLNPPKGFGAAPLVGPAGVDGLAPKLNEKAEPWVDAPCAAGALAAAGALEAGAAEGVALAPPVKPKLNFAGAAPVLEEAAGMLAGALLAGAANAGALGWAKADCCPLDTGALGCANENLGGAAAFVDPAAGLFVCCWVAGELCTCGPRRASKEGVVPVVVLADPAAGFSVRALVDAGVVSVVDGPKENADLGAELAAVLADD